MFIAKILVLLTTNFWYCQLPIHQFPFRGKIALVIYAPTQLEWSKWPEKQSSEDTFLPKSFDFFFFSVEKGQAGENLLKQSVRRFMYTYFSWMHFLWLITRIREKVSKNSIAQEPSFYLKIKIIFSKKKLQLVCLFVCLRHLQIIYYFRSNF